MQDNESSLLVLGAGAWGTALAVQAARVKKRVRLWARSVQQVAMLREKQQNIRYLPGIILPDTIQFYSDLQQACQGVDSIIVVVPSSAFRETLSLLSLACSSGAFPKLLLACKGFDKLKMQLFSETVAELAPAFLPQLAFLSGPSFAVEVAAGLPTTAVLSSTNNDTAVAWRSCLHAEQFRIYLNEDIVATQIGGALKNPIAIAAGIADGLNLGANARAALITRGLNEMMRFAQRLGGRAETLSGLAGLGDLVLTCTDNQSRNRRLGLALGRGLTKQQALQEITQVVEGIDATACVVRWAKHYAIEMPIVEQVHNVITQACSAQQAVANLFARGPKAENNFVN